MIDQILALVALACVESTQELLEALVTLLGCDEATRAKIEKAAFVQVRMKVLTSHIYLLVRKTLRIYI
jgi:hypothetical protein